MSVSKNEIVISSSRWCNNNYMLPLIRQDRLKILFEEHADEREKRMREEKVSIVVPVYNVEKYLKRCVESLLNQTYSNIEIILVDDGSSDHCPVLCDNYAKKDDRVIVIHKKNGGLSDARNCGLLKASGEYILYVDSDDYIERDSCEKLIVGMIENVDVVVGAYNELRSNKIIEKRHSNLSQNRIYNAKEYVISAIKCDEWYAPAWLNLYRKSFLIENNLYYKVGFYFEDIEMLPRLFLANPKVTYVDYSFYNYVIRENSIMTSQETPEKVQMSLEIYSNWMKLFSKVDDQLYKTYLYGILIKYYIATARQRKFYGWKIPGLDFSFAWKYSLNGKEKVKALLFNYFPRQYVKLANRQKGE